VHYDYRRKQSAELATTIDGEQAGRAAANAQSYTLNSSLKMDLYKALSLLKDEERTCITLQLIDGQPIDKISDITGIPQNTVKSHLKRGKEKLASYLKENGYDR
jgi:RNA polymerase sigma-70 factor (ECF subfamily)